MLYSVRCCPRDRCRLGRASRLKLQCTCRELSCWGTRCPLSEFQWLWNWLQLNRLCPECLEPNNLVVGISKQLIGNDLFVFQYLLNHIQGRKSQLWRLRGLWAHMIGKIQTLHGLWFKFLFQLDKYNSVSFTSDHTCIIDINESGRDVREHYGEILDSAYYSVYMGESRIQNHIVQHWH